MPYALHVYIVCSTTDVCHVCINTKEFGFFCTNSYETPEFVIQYFYKVMSNLL